MPISIEGPKKDNLCRGGRSFGCKKISETADAESRTLGPHEARHPRTCRRCHAYMGCFICAHPPVELVCLNCHDWATEEAEREHGKMISRVSVQAKMRPVIDKFDAIESRMAAEAKP